MPCGRVFVHLLRDSLDLQKTLDFPDHYKITGTLEQCLKSRTYSVIVLAISEQGLGTNQNKPDLRHLRFA
jgi:hypothetical protein